MAALLAGCTTDEATVRITVQDSETGAPVPGALVGIEVGGAYVPTPDPAKGNPSWTFGGLANDEGVVEIVLDTGLYGFHSFAEEYIYGTNEVEIDGDPFDVTVDTKGFDPAVESVPLAEDFAIEPDTVAPGAEFEVSVTATAVNIALSEEVLVFLPSEQLCAAMDPPSAGDPGVAYPDGIYRKTVTAPTEPGTYDVYVAVTSEGCITAPPQSLQLTVQ
jgi:hypothetical protein